MSQLGVPYSWGGGNANGPSRGIDQGANTVGFDCSGLMLYAFAICKPRSAGQHFIQPKSALAYPLAIIRIFGRWGVSMPSYKMLKAAVSGLVIALWRHQDLLAFLKPFS